ncbi:cytochrome P450 [Rhexocercosporidium sp. MPI-PUGE-AT-0058]|nr:cytochrome P450 [Rhexocercosporidium sp. MPI-PUGE-AT-0058]
MFKMWSLLVATATIFKWTLFVVLGKVLYNLIYNAYFHPLAHFPGPKVYGATRIPLAVTTLRGNLAYTVKELHDKYGEVVRTAPDELSFTSASASKDIYLRKGSRPALPKDPHTYAIPAGAKHSMATVPSDADHSRYRRLLSHAFSDKALQEQAVILKKYVDFLIRRLHENADRGAQDMVAWYNYTTFDIIGDLTLGESFNCLEDSTLHEWIRTIFKSLKAATLMGTARKFPALSTALMKMIPKSMLANRAKHVAFTTEKVEKRMAQGDARPDFMSYVLRHNDKETGMSKEEIIPTFAVLILAGSETTATLLSVVTYCLLSNPQSMKKLVHEIRTTFEAEDEITQISVGKLRYQSAVLEEALRIQPPTPMGLPRVVTKSGGDTIGGHWIPQGTTVIVSTYATNRSATNWTDAEKFIPERWLDDPRFETDNKSCFYPFSLGPRNCIGRNLAYAEMRLILARVLWNFDLELDEESRSWTDNMKMFMLWEKPKLFVKLTPVIRT